MQVSWTEIHNAHKHGTRQLEWPSFQWKKQCHNFCGWLPNAVPLLRQIALLNYVLQNILCKRPLLWGIDIKLQLL